ncbi:MAG TPA: hypothetical protein VFW69_10830 [Mycobacterium sp.]|nr:hypothetical protein [Mycobacterium sp.]
MDADNNLTVDSGSGGATAVGRPDGVRRRNTRPWINWGLALATVPAAAIVMLFALGAIMSTDGCSDRSCPNLGHGGINFGVAFYGAPAVAVVVIIISFFTAKRRGGIAVPLCGWALLVADVALMAASVAG